MTYIKEINKNAYDSHQTSPGYLLTFLRWSNRDTYNYDNIDSMDIRKPLVVYNDAIQVSVSNQKNSLTPTVSIILKGGDLNYETALSPGDFVLVNMVNWEDDAERLRDRAVALRSINRYGDGFKGVFKIQSVVDNVIVDEQSGKKTITYSVLAAGFTELNNVVHYNPIIASTYREDGTAMYQTQVGDSFANLLKGTPECQTILKILFKSLLGNSRKKNDNKGVVNYGNNHFKVPINLGKLLGLKDAKYAVDIYNIIIGIWGSSSSRVFSDSYSGFNQLIQPDTVGSNFFNTGSNRRIQGNKLAKLEDWNRKQAWSLIKGYSNAVLNESYTTFRISPDSNKVMPTVIVRQKPFTNKHFKVPNGFNVTQFFDLPRWKISADLLLSKQTAKNEATRFNMVQVFSRTIPDIQEINQAAQIQMKNYQLDKKDIQRNGLKPYIVTSDFDFLNNKEKTIRAKPWSQIVSDWILEGHLKKSGTFSFYGIQDPISVGDNLEFDNIVYHIESVQHTMSMVGDRKKFRTKISVSYGMDKRSSKDGPVYAGMEHTDYYTLKKEDDKFEKILPGFSDAQDIKGRTKGEEKPKNNKDKDFETQQISFTPKKLRKPRNK